MRLYWPASDPVSPGDIIFNDGHGASPRGDYRVDRVSGRLEPPGVEPYHEVEVTLMPPAPEDDLGRAAVLLGRKGGQRSTPRKRAAARANGRLGGRPRVLRTRGKSSPEVE